MIVYRMISYFKEIVNRYQVILERFPKLLFYIFLRELGAEVVVLCYIFKTLINIKSYFKKLLFERIIGINCDFFKDLEI
jgi:hypothetical protein